MISIKSYLSKTALSSFMLKTFPRTQKPVKPADHIINHMVSEALKNKLEVQGYCNINDQRLDETANWLRLAPAICLLGVLTGTLLQSHLILAVFAPIAALGTVLPHTPFGYFYNYVIRRFTETAKLPVNKAPRKFACLIATVWVSATAYMFYINQVLIGQVLGIAMVFVAGMMAFRHYCIASVIWRKTVGWKENER